MEAAGLTALPRPALESLSDEALCERTAHGDTGAFETLFRRHQRGLLSFCRHMLRSLHEAEDVVQQTFLSAYRQISDGAAPEHCRAWLYAAARNRCISILRSRPQPWPERAEPETEGLDSQVERRSELRALLGGLERLPSDQRAAIVLFELGALSQAEIATVLHVDQPKVKSLVFQARSTLASFRDAGEMPCAVIRRQLSILRGGALNARSLKHHLELCPGCAGFREELRTQRRGLAIVVPVVPVAASGTKLLALIAGGGGAAAGTGAAAGSNGATAASGAAAGSAGGGSSAASGVLGSLQGAWGAIGAVAATATVAAGVYGATNLVGGEPELPAATPPANASLGGQGAPGPAGGSPSVARRERPDAGVLPPPGSDAAQGAFRREAAPAQGGHTLRGGGPRFLDTSGPDGGGSAPRPDDRRSGGGDPDPPAGGGGPAPGPSPGTGPSPGGSSGGAPSADTPAATPTPPVASDPLPASPDLPRPTPPATNPGSGGGGSNNGKHNGHRDHPNNGNHNGHGQGVGGGRNH